MIYAGCDLGIVSAKAAIVNNGKILATETFTYKSHPKHAAEKVMARTLDKAGLVRDQIDYCVATGFGRRAVKFADEATHDISCLHRAIPEIDPEIKTIIDVGGHTLQAVALHDRGTISENISLQRCVNGTGLAIDVLARVMEMPITEIIDLSLTSDNPVPLTSQCVVLAESEVISRINEGKEIKDIFAGVLSFVAIRISSIIRKVRIRNKVAFIGGVAKNRFIRNYLEESLGTSFENLSGYASQEISAVGAALLARDRHEKRIEHGA